MAIPPLSEQQQAEARRLVEALRPHAEDLLQHVARLLVANPGASTFGATESQLRDLLLRAGADFLETSLAQKKNGYVGSSFPCPQCSQAADFHGYRSRNSLISLLGPLRLERAYYYCRRCGQGYYPFDHQAGLTPRHLTPAADEAVSLAGLLTDSFAEAAQKVLPKLSGLRLGEATVTRATEDAGARLGESLEQGDTLGETTPWAWQKDQHGRTVAYVSIDATGVRQQAQGGGPADGRMPYVAMVYNPPPEKPPAAASRPSAPPLQARYLAGLYSLAALGLLVRRQAAQVGMEQAEVWVGLSDAGNGLDDFLQTNFNRPDLVLILDFYHPASRLEELARCYHPQDTAAAQTLAQSWCRTLKHEGGGVLLDQLRALPPPKGSAGRENYQETVPYFANHQRRMDYPHYLAQGWHIGSGAVESACKTVVGQRLKLAGMRWREYGTDNVCHLRALFKSEKGQWDAFWSRRMNKGSIFYQPK